MRNYFSNFENPDNTEFLIFNLGFTPDNRHSKCVCILHGFAQSLVSKKSISINKFDQKYNFFSHVSNKTMKTLKKFE